MGFNKNKSIFKKVFILIYFLLVISTVFLIIRLIDSKKEISDINSDFLTLSSEYRELEKDSLVEWGDGYDTGYSNGYDSAYSEANESAMAKHPDFNEISSLSYDNGYNYGYEEGYSSGYDEGYLEGYHEAERLEDETPNDSETNERSLFGTIFLYAFSILVALIILRITTNDS